MIHIIIFLNQNQTAMPVRVMKLVGVETIFVTNAGGGLNKTFQVLHISTKQKVPLDIAGLYVLILIIFAIDRQIGKILVLCLEL